MTGEFALETLLGRKVRIKPETDFSLWHWKSRDEITECQRFRLTGTIEQADNQRVQTGEWWVFATFGAARDGHWLRLGDLDLISENKPAIPDDPLLVKMLRVAADASQYDLMERFHAEAEGQVLLVLYSAKKQRYHLEDRPYEAARKMLSGVYGGGMLPIGIVRNGVILAQRRPLVLKVEETSK